MKQKWEKNARRRCRLDELLIHEDNDFVVIVVVLVMKY